MNLYKFLGLAGLGVCTLFVGAFLIVVLVPAPEAGKANQDSLLMELRGGASTILSKLPLVPRDHSERSLLAVMIENHEVARPYHEGFKNALFVGEFLVEGYISRFVLILDRDHLPSRVGPVRSLRSYFIDAVLPWTRLFIHAGGSPDALERVQEDESIVAFNALPIEEEYFVRDETVPAPHDLFIKKGKIKELFEGVRRRETTWPPYPVSSDVESDQTAEKIKLQFFSSLHNVTYEYNDWRKTYKRTNGGEVAETQPYNVLVLEVPIDAIVEYGRLKMSLTGKGPLMLFRDGKIVRGYWERTSLDQSPQFFSKNGQLLEFASGQTWMTVLPSLERVSYE